MTSMNSKVSRRQVLVLGGLTLGVGAVNVAGFGGTAYADATTGDVTLAPVGANPVVVLPGVGVQPAAFPRQLAVQVKHDGTDLPAGTQVAITYDPRLYAPLPTAMATIGRHRVHSTSKTTTDPKTTLVTCTVTLTEALPGGSEPVVVVGTAVPVLYPLDLVVAPVGATAAVARKNGKPTGRHSLKTHRPAAFGGVATPWGIEVSGVWERYEWADGKRWYYYPARITLHNVGPGTAPAAAAFSVALDPQVVRDVSVTGARLNHTAHDAGVRQLASSRTASLFETRWRTRVHLKAGDRLDLAVKVTTRKPAHDLPTIKHPTVGLIDTGNHITQRQTGLTSLSRTDSRWQ
ncbi:hypothetical protein [Streptomyces montanisoli]|uniref:Uncharacterized protein n=1 Tax=Streptomyces montanisoli TaxID=2798581 RepID=A0A940MH83_9ACTN|nr:hypothetical protein [Streptomyces montanisoli]MBP0461042.1 hypothetical protein [Streptomyces montanisoli]